MRSKLSLLICAALAATAFSVVPARAKPACTGNPRRLLSTRSIGLTSGKYTLPARAPLWLIVFMHGQGKPPRLGYWDGHLREAARHGSIAIAMNYSERRAVEPDGWFVREGADRSIAAARLLLARCRSVRTTVVFSPSMGGNTGGLAVAEGAKRPRSSLPLFDYWFQIEGVNNVAELYLEARAVAISGNTRAVGAVKDIEAEMGGPIEAVPESYLEHTIVARIDDIAAAGIKGVVIAHSTIDGTVPHDQSRELAVALAAVGIPFDFHTIVRRGARQKTDDTTLTSYVLPSLGIDDAQQPLAGHAPEESTTHPVMRISLERLWALMAGTYVPGPAREFVVDGDAPHVP